MPKVQVMPHPRLTNPEKLLRHMLRMLGKLSRFFKVLFWLAAVKFSYREGEN